MGQTSPSAPGGLQPYQHPHPQQYQNQHPPTCLPCTSQLAYPAPHLLPTNPHPHPHPHQQATQALDSFDQVAPIKTALLAPCGPRPMAPSQDDGPRPHPLSVYDSERENLWEALNEPDPFSPPPVLDQPTSSAPEERFSTGYAPRSPTTDASAEASHSEWAPGEAAFGDEPPLDCRPRRNSYMNRFFASSAPPDVPLPSPLVATNSGSSASVYTAQWTPKRTRYQDGDMNQRCPGGIAYRIIRPPPGFESASAVIYYYHNPDEPRICQRCYSAEAVYPAEFPVESSWASIPPQDVGRPRTLDSLANSNANASIDTGIDTGLCTGMNTANLNTGGTNTLVNDAGMDAGINASNFYTGVSIIDQNTNSHNTNGYTANIISPIPTYPCTTIATPPPTYPNTIMDAPPAYPTATSDCPPAYTPTYYGTYYGDEGDIENIHDRNVRVKLNRLLFRSAAMTLAALYPSFPIPSFGPEDEYSNADADGDDDDDYNFQAIPSTVSTAPLQRQAEQGDIPIIATVPLHSLPPPKEQGTTVTTINYSNPNPAISSFFVEGTDDEKDNEDEDDDYSDWSTSSPASYLAAAYLFSPRAGSPPPVSAFDFSDDDGDDDDDDGDDDENDYDGEEAGPSTTDTEADRVDFELELTNFFQTEWDWEALLREAADL